MTLSDESAEKPKKKRGRPKGSKKKPKAEAKPKVKSKKSKKGEPKPVLASETGLTAAEVATLAEAQEKAAAARLEAARSAAEAAAEEQYQAAAAEAVAVAADSFSDKYNRDRIFRREMGEPEFFQYKKDLHPPRTMLSKEEEANISRKVQIPADQTPLYKPEYILSPEFRGVSNYERGVADFKQELEEKLQHLKANTDSSPEQITQTQEDLKTLDYLYENFFDGMNVFRTAKGGRDKLRE